MKPYFKIITILFIIGLVKESFAQTPLFRNYKTKLFIGMPATLKIKGNVLAERYKTAISNSYYDDPYIRKFHGKGGLNFAGHYCFVYWGCGSDCQHGAIVDLQTGNVYDGPTAARQFEYKRWSGSGFNISFSWPNINSPALITVACPVLLSCFASLPVPSITG